MRFARGTGTIAQWHEARGAETVQAYLKVANLRAFLWFVQGKKIWLLWNYKALKLALIGYS